MSKWEAYRCDVWGNDTEGYTVNDVIPMGVVFDGDASKRKLCEIFGLADPYKLELDDSNEGVIYADYDGIPTYEFRRIDND